MGTWIAKLAGHKDDAAIVLKDPHSIAAYTLVFGLAFLVLLLWITIVILTAIRIFKKYRRRSQDAERETKVRAFDVMNPGPGGGLLRYISYL